MTDFSGRDPKSGHKQLYIRIKDANVSVNPAPQKAVNPLEGRSGEAPAGNERAHQASHLGTFSLGIAPSTSVPAPVETEPVKPALPAGQMPKTLKDARNLVTDNPSPVSSESAKPSIADGLTSREIARLLFPNATGRAKKVHPVPGFPKPKKPKGSPRYGYGVGASNLSAAANKADVDGAAFRLDASLPSPFASAATQQKKADDVGKPTLLGQTSDAINEVIGQIGGDRASTPPARESTSSPVSDDESIYNMGPHGRPGGGVELPKDD